MIYCSVGEMCQSSMLLKDNGMKDASYPFDWIFSSVPMVKHCIEDGFKTFLNKEYYLKHPEDIKKCHHTFYSQLMYEYEEGYIFNHHNPLENEADYSYLERCVNRFKDLLASPEEKTFVLFFKDKPNDYESWLKEASSLCNFLYKHTTNYTVLCIYHNPVGKQGHRWIKSKGLKFLHLQTLSKTTGTHFHNRLDNEYLNKILHEIR